MDNATNRAKPFEFMQCISILKSTAKRAANLRELRDLIATVSEESIFHHTCQYFLKGRIREYTNDFAHWVGESLEESALAEQLSSIDPYEFKNISGVRSALLTVIDNYIESFPEPREALSGEEFYFNETITIVFPARIRARNLAEFLIAIRYIDAASIYYHFHEARTRLGGGTDDFSKWFDEVLGEQELAKRLWAIDPFMHSIEGIREHIVEIVDEKVKQDMEITGVEE
ncbi:MAG: hypothetical protein GXO94_00625 [Nitrospirae bacterium]|nr:hypothetical protein [Nitrospirota bacterium]